MHHQLSTLHLFPVCKPSCCSWHDTPPTIPWMEWVIAFLNFLKSLLKFSHPARVNSVLPLAIMGMIFYPIFPPPHPPPRAGLTWPQRKHGVSFSDAAWPAQVWLTRSRTGVETGSLAFSLLKHPRVIPSEILVTPECCDGWAVGPSYSEHSQHLSSSPSSLRNASLPPPTTFKGTPLSPPALENPLIISSVTGFPHKTGIAADFRSPPRQGSPKSGCLRWESQKI